VVPLAIFRCSFPSVLDAVDSEGRVYSPQHHYQCVCQKAREETRVLGSVFHQRLTVASDRDCFKTNTITRRFLTLEKSWHDSVALQFDIMVRILLKDKHSKTPLIRTLFTRANYLDRLGPSGKYVEKPTELTCLEITAYRIKYSTVLRLLELQISRDRKV